MAHILSFSGHETFTFRHGWLKKGVDAASLDPACFARERALIDLGVGKNMVSSIRHWCLAAGLIQESREHRGQFVVTEIGRRIFANAGLDPYLEDPGTLWLIHWMIASNFKGATTWFWMFSNWNGVEFTRERIAFEIQSWLEKHGYKPISENTLKRDIDCFVHTYVHSRHAKSSVIEDTLDCPLVDLRLISELADGKTYQFQRGPQVSLPNEIFLYALAEFWNVYGGNAKSIAFEKIAYDPGSPGRIFKLDEDSLAGRLESIAQGTRGGFTYDETAGLKQVYKHKEVDLFKMLERYYLRKVSRTMARKAG
jgi:Protein of unknown function (DUF4007)